MRGEVVPRDDRAWPRSSLLVSAGLALAAVGSGVGLVFGAAGRGSLALALVALGFVLAFGFGLAVSVPVMRHWIAGRSVPGRFHLLAWTGFVVAFVVLGRFDGHVGGGMLAGLMGGLCVANIWGIRTARANRDLVDEAAAAAARAQEAARHHAIVAAALDAEARPSAPVGEVLRNAVALQRRRLVAWLVAGAVAVVACGVLDAPDLVAGVVVATAGLTVIWVLRRLWAAWLALRSFTKGATSPRRAFVVLLHDPAPQTIRPLLGVWADAPVLRDGRLPTPERVYRCDEKLDALECLQGNIVIHEAWVDTPPRRWAKPRWVAADAGIALPQRPALFGRWYMSNLLSGQRPEQPRRLTLQRPHRGNQAIVERRRDVGSFPAERRERRNWRLHVKRGFPRRRQRGPRRKALLKQDRHWLRADEVPTAGVTVDRACASQFDRFNAFRDQLAPGVRLPVQLDVLLRRDGPGRISVWKLPSGVVKAIFVGYLSGVAVSEYEAVLHRLTHDQAPMALFTAHQLGAGRYDAVVEGRPSDWSIPET